AYVSGTNTYLTHYAGDAWQTETVFTGDVENGVALAFDPNGQPALAIAGNDSFTGALTYLYKDAGAWQSQTVATDHGGLEHPSLAFDPSDGQPAISYTGTLGDLTFAKFNGSAWSKTTIDSTVSFGGQSELKYRPVSQDPVIVYEDTWTNTLRLAELTAGSWHTLDIETGEWANYDIGVHNPFGMDVMIDDRVYISWARGFSPDAMRLSLYDGELHSWVALDEFRISGSALLVQGDDLGIAFGNSYTSKLRYASGPAPVPEPSIFALLTTGVASVLFMAWGRRKRIIIVLNTHALTVVACSMCVLCCATPVSAELIVKYEFSPNLLPSFTADHVTGASSYWTASSSSRSVVAGTNMGHPSPGFRSDGWKYTNYAYFSVSIEDGYLLTLDGVEFDSKSENYGGYLGPNKYDVKYSTDGSNFTSISAGWQTLYANNIWYANRLAYDTGDIGTLMDTVYFRIYGTGANDSWSYWFHDDVEVFGSIAPIPEPSTLALLATGVASVLFMAWRRRKRSR
ncbi:MAG: PEP-CTERM sorting domain-containing protein, partial [Planctomycetes bacterium]|nr:PEP-CTERM sorting domain-containing protein [Planctomycetota bacterium]